jgi:predicted PurR-regulated permease PerM
MKLKNVLLLNIVLSIVLAILVGWLLFVGKGLLLPILTALIAVYVIISTADALHRLPVLSVMPVVALRFMILAGFAGILFGLSLVVVYTIRDIIALAPAYQANLLHILDGTARYFDIESEELWNRIRTLTIERVNLQSVAISALGAATHMSGTIFLIIVYSAFIIGERGKFQMKVVAAFRSEEAAERTLHILRQMNGRIRDYITIKTLINIVLGAISYGILLLFGVDFPLFWAIFIALLNYIPYIGSYVGVALPVILSLAQFGSIGFTLLMTGLLTAAQIFVSEFLEPRMIGREMNLSPLIVLIALSFWTSIWGLAGAILAIPMTSILMIAMSSFESTRFVAILCQNRAPEEVDASALSKLTG